MHMAPFCDTLDSTSTIESTGTALECTHQRKNTHLAAAARTHTNNPPTSFPGKSFKASEHYNPTAKSKSNPPTQSEINKATSPNDHTRKLRVTAPRTHAANLSEAAGSDEEEELTGEAADRPVMRQNMAAAAAAG